MAVAFLLSSVLADRIGLQRDVYYGVYAASAVGLFVGWSRDTGQSLRELCARRWRLAAALGLIAAGAMAFLATREDVSGSHPGGLTLAGSVAWRGVVYGAADGLLLSAFPILLIFAALKNTSLRKRAGGALAVGAVAIIASMAMTAVYHAGYSDFRSSKLSKPLTGDLVWSIPTLATLNPIGAGCARRAARERPVPQLQLESVPASAPLAAGTIAPRERSDDGNHQLTYKTERDGNANDRASRLGSTLPRPVPERHKLQA